MDIADAFNKEIIEDIIKVHPRYLGSNIKTHIANVIKHQFEDKGSKHGFIRKGTVELVHVGAMQGEMHTLRGYVNANVRFSALVCNPSEKSVVKAVVRSINKFGVMTVCEIDGLEVMHIVVPRNILSVKSLVSIDMLHPGDTVLVEIIKRKFEVGEPVMYGIGRIVGDTAPNDRETDDEMDIDGVAAVIDHPSDDDNDIEVATDNFEEENDQEESDVIDIEEDDDKKEEEDEDDEEEFELEEDEDDDVDVDDLDDDAEL